MAIALYKFTFTIAYHTIITVNVEVKIVSYSWLERRGQS